MVIDHGRRESSSTVPEDPRPRWDAFELWLRRFVFALVAAVVLAGLIGVLGVRTTVTHAAAGGYRLEVEYAGVSRPGLGTPLSIRVAAEDGSLPSRLTLRLDSAYLAMFDENGITPDPAESFNDSANTEWTFDVPDGRRQFAVDFDARMAPSTQSGERATVDLIVDGRAVAGVEFSTRVMP